MKKLLTILLFTTNCYAYQEPKGAIDVSVTQENLNTTVCVPGYTATVRPPVSYTNKVKHNLATNNDDPKQFELDHYVPLAVGGHPTSLDNLWLQSWNGSLGAHTKDVVETQVHRKLCKGQLTLKQAQWIFLNGWTKYKLD